MGLNKAIKAEERREIQRVYRQLLRSCKPMMESADIGLIRKALNMTAANGSDVVRNEAGELKVLESLEVALVVVNELGLSRVAVVGALLYDAVLEGSVTNDEVEKTFGKQVALITRGLVKVGELYNKNTSIENDNFRKLLLTFAEDIRVVLLIIANRLRTMRKLALYNADNQQRISSEVAYLYAPMAHRLGLYNIKSEMEDLVMKFTNREMYSFIAKKLNETKRARDKYIREFIEPLETQLRKQGLKFEIKGRTKTIHSIYNKLKKQNTEFENVYDSFAIRVILNSELDKEKAECWQVYL